MALHPLHKLFPPPPNIPHDIHTKHKPLPPLISPAIGILAFALARRDDFLVTGLLCGSVGQVQSRARVDGRALNALGALFADELVDGEGEGDVGGLGEALG